MGTLIIGDLLIYIHVHQIVQQISAKNVTPFAIQKKFLFVSLTIQVANIDLSFVSSLR